MSLKKTNKTKKKAPVEPSIETQPVKPVQTPVKPSIEPVEKVEPQYQEKSIKTEWENLKAWFRSRFHG